jgi:hypothetical protein
MYDAALLEAWWMGGGIQEGSKTDEKTKGGESNKLWS